ncbi:hypothetical protein HPB47_011895 [Ixodes persulcatus]|uniref:Uncharacterized protein n=1 Tax=Ixodes persulcatus TaxID=34615 RepID=A0AC60NVC8_IXOPE|nr:hypothetical protein HPB47_011895 [Ixodes persulcatus]
MENLGLKLNEAEHRYFAELFAAYDVDNQDKVSGSKASELLLATQLPTEVLQQITEVCGAKRLGHFGRPQFYLAMKLIGAAQAGLPVKLDIVSSGVEVPLPKFHRSNEVGQPTQLPPPPSAKSHNKTSRQSSLKDLETSPQHQPFSQAAPNYSFVPPPPRGSRDSSPDGQTSDKTWTRFHQPGERQLNWSHFEEHRQLLGNEEDSSDRHSSDEEHDIWSIADDQRDYYTNQFQAMQPDLRGKITGAIAKEFFEKSKLPVHELSKIWQLSDIDKDGALSIEEFRTAMHLVVLRRNSIELPEVLPPSLVPKLPQKPADVVDASGHQAPSHPAPVPRPRSHSPPLKEPLSPQNKEWTKFNDSPTSTVSSPSMKPDPRILHPVARRVSPDGHAIPYTSEQEKPAISADACGDCKGGATQKNIVKRLPGSSATLPMVPQQTLAYVVTTEVSGDVAANSFSGAVAGAPTLAGSQGQLSLPQGPKKEPPPPPPPRPKRNHARSSSLDLNRLGCHVNSKQRPCALEALKENLTGFSLSPLHVTAHVTRNTVEELRAVSKSITGDVPSGMDFADFDHFAESRSDVATGPPSQHQFQVRSQL